MLQAALKWWAYSESYPGFYSGGADRGWIRNLPKGAEPGA